MKTNYHTHSKFSDGLDTLQQIADHAIGGGFDAIGFSDHGYTPYDLRYCMKDVEGYIKTVNSLKGELGGKIEIYLGVEEDAFAPVKNRSDYDYIIGSCHYIRTGERHIPLDSSRDYFLECLDFFKGDSMAFARQYYEEFCGYIVKRKPDIIGHFDLITKYDESFEPVFLENKEYAELSEHYLEYALRADCLFEVNTGAIARELRSTPYPYSNLLYKLSRQGGRVILSSDCHDKNKLSFCFDEARKMLSYIGFDCIYHLVGNNFVKEII